MIFYSNELTSCLHSILIVHYILKVEIVYGSIIIILVVCLNVVNIVCISLLKELSIYNFEDYKYFN